jgi:hypothetical protein
MEKPTGQASENEVHSAPDDVEREILTRRPGSDLTGTHQFHQADD